MNNLKDQIIFNVFEFLETGDMQHARIAKSDLEILAKIFHVKLKLIRITNIKNAFSDFILNQKGYNETIPKLYYAI